MEGQELVEKEFLSILVLHPEIGFDLLQYIKPNYLTEKNRSKVFEISLELHEKGLSADVPTIVKKNPSLCDEIAEIISDELITITDIRKQFMTCQIMILDTYKKKVINDLNQKLNKGKITCDEYLTKMGKINEIAIKDETTVLTSDEIRNNISTEKIAIKLKKFPLLNRTLKLVQTDFLMIGASTGTGKSGLLLNFMSDLMDDYQCIYFNMEMSKSTIYKRLISINGNVPLNDIDKPKSEYQKECIDKTIETLEKKQLIIEHKATYIQEIKQVISRHKQDNKHTIVFLDHIGLIRIFGSNKSIYEQTTEIAKTLRQYCLEYNCTIISACQLNRASYNSEELNISMLKDSGELENSASKVILLYKDKEKISSNELIPNMVLELVKNRDSLEIKISCKYDKTKQIFIENVDYKGE